MSYPTSKFRCQIDHLPTGGGERSGSQPLGFSPVKQHSGRERNSGVPLAATPASAALGMPHPRILDWVLGNRGTLADRSKGRSLSKVALFYKHVSAGLVTKYRSVPWGV